MSRNMYSKKWKGALGIIACTLMASPALLAETQIERPAIVALSSDHGPLNPQQQVTLTVHLTPTNKAALDKAVSDLYTPGSPSYHHWMSSSDLAKYAPSKDQLESVKKELTSHGLQVVSVSADGLSIRTRGSASSVESAFQTQLHEFERNGHVFHANVTSAKLTGSAGSLVNAVSGLSSIPMRPHIKALVDPRTGKPFNAKGSLKTSSSATGTFATVASTACFSAPTTVTLSPPTGQTLPVATYFGNNYGPASPLACAYTPTELKNYYNLYPELKAGFDGTGQTIVLVEGPVVGSQILSDLKSFSKLAGLPAPTNGSFQVVYPDGQPTEIGLENDSFDGEAQLDAEYAHGIAPGAKIIMVVMPTDDWSEFEFGIQYIVDNKLGWAVSNSYGFPEALWGAHTLDGFEQTLENAAAAGIAVNFSTGDSGDEGTGAPNAGGASYPSGSAFATAIGGTSIGLPDGSKNGTDVGWGNNVSFLSFGTGDVEDPPFSEGLFGGSGGGENSMVAKPSWQSVLPGTGRQQPDISADADPFTGVVFYADGGIIAGEGGTSLSCPIVTAMWTIANQKAGASLGQIAPALYTAKSTLTAAVKDVVPFASTTNPSGFIVDSTGSTFYSSDAIIVPVAPTTQYFAGMWNIGGGEIVDISFGTDSSLSSTKGWDNVTGWGTPRDASKFIDAAVALK